MGKTKSCPKCRGNVFVDWDFDFAGWYESCLQCGYRHYLPIEAKAQEKPAKPERTKKRKTIQ